MREPYKNPNSNARFAAARFCAVKFMDRGVKFYKARLRETDFLTRAAELYGTKFHEIKLQTPNSELKMKFGEVKFGGVKFRGGALLKFAAAKGLRRSSSLCAAAPFKFTAPQNAGFFATKFDKTEFLGANFHGAKFQEMEFQTLNLELKMKFNAAKFGEVKFRDGALLKFAAAKGLRRSPSLCAAPQNAGFFEIKFGEARFCDVKFHKARSRRAKFYAAEFTAKSEKFYGAKRRGAGA